RLTKGHTGKVLCDALVGCLKEFGIKNKVLSVVADNASNNDTMMDQLEIEIGRQLGVQTRTRCF
ncbi:hypothetical protein SCHPADRAFT_798112, partial [Schizopora paradoxa]